LASATSEEIAAFKLQQAEYNRNVKQWQEDTPKVTRNSALVAVTALLLGLLGSVIGGWMASGEPMNFVHYRTRKPRYHTVV
jgi:anti-sigma factor RsiW